MLIEECVLFNSDIVIIGAGSAGLSCAYSICKARPDLLVTCLEAGVSSPYLAKRFGKIQGYERLADLSHISLSNRLGRPWRRLVIELFGRSMSMTSS